MRSFHSTTTSCLESRQQERKRVGRDIYVYPLAPHSGSESCHAILAHSLVVVDEQVVREVGVVAVKFEVVELSRRVGWLPLHLT